MKSVPLARLLATVLLFSALARAGAEEKLPPAFSALTFEAACQQAAAGHKIVFIDFYTTWCAPCKMLDETTWQDAAVIALLREKSVALKIDAEKEKALTRRYQLNAYPTLLLLKPDGTELDRIVGYRESAKFIEEFSAGLAGQTALQRARAAVTNSTDDDHRVQARYDLARELARTGQSAAALAEYLWCYDEGMVQAQNFAGVRVSHLLNSIATLGENFPPALAALEERRAKAKAAFLAGNADPATARDLAALNRQLGAEADTLALYSQLPRTDARRRALGYSLYDKLLDARRYEEALEAEPFAAIGKRWAFWQAEDSQNAAAKMPAEMLKMKREYFVKWFAEHLEVLAGAGQLDDAREFLATALAYDGSPEARAVYREHLARAGRGDLLPEIATAAAKS